MLSQNDVAIIKAYEIGYRADEEGNIYYPEGKLRPIKSIKKVYLNFRPNRGIKGSPLVHRFIAYCFYGDKVFGKVVMHLDDNTRNNHINNLKVGTQKDNMAMKVLNVDKVKESADKISKSKRKLDHDLIHRLAGEGKGTKEIADITGYRYKTVSSIKNGSPNYKRKY